MKKNIIISAVILILTVIPVLGQDVEGERASYITISMIEGRVEKKIDVPLLTDLFNIKTWHKIKKGDRLQAGDEIRTDSEGKLEFHFNNDTYVKVASETEIMIGEEKKDGGKAGVSLELKDGRIWSRVKNVWQDLTKFEVITPSAVAGVRGTLFSVFVRDETTVLSVKEGRVEFEMIDEIQRVEVKAGEMSLAHPERILTPVKIDKEEELNWRKEEVKEWRKRVDELVKKQQNVQADKSQVNPAGSEKENEKKNDEVMEEEISAQDEGTEKEDKGKKIEDSDIKKNIEDSKEDTNESDDNEREQDNPSDNGETGKNLK